MIEVIVTSSVLILMITALRHLFRGRISSQLQYALWLLVAIRLLLPFSLFESPVSVMNFLPDIQKTVSVTVPSEDTVKTENSGNAGNTGNALPLMEDNSSLSHSGQTMPDSLKGTENSFNGEALVKILWLGGLILSGAIFAVSNLHLSRKLRRSRKQIEVPGYPLPVYVTEILPSPCLYGIIKPVVYATPESFSEKRSEYVLAHELTHYRQKDHIWSFVRVLCLCLHWFNPLVWMAVILSRRDSELACDERTIRWIGSENRMEYGRTLIEMMTEPTKPMDIFRCATTMTSGKGEMTERIKRIAKTPKTLRIALTVTVVVAVVAVALTFGGAAGKTSKIPIVLPQSNTVTSITLEQFNEGGSLGAVQISQKADLEAVLNALGDTSKTRRQSVNDAPNQESYIQIDVKSADSRRFYLYKSYKKYYIEEPYVGIYRSNQNMSAVITKLYNPDRQESGSMNVQQMWEARTPYVGDNSAVGALLGLLPLPQGLSHDHFALRTAGNEHGIEWVLKGDETASYEGSSLRLNAILLFALVDNLQDFYVTMIDLEQEEIALHYDRAWADGIAGCDIRDYAESPEKLQELLDYFGMENAFAQYSIAKLGKNGEYIEGYYQNQKLAMAIISDYKVKSANWVGVDIATLKECYLIRQFFPEELETYDYYAYLKKDGTAVLQLGTEGQYSMLSPELYSELVNSVQTSTADSWIENEYTKGVPRPDFDNLVWMAPDNENEYCAALYQEVDRDQIEQYLKTLKEDGWKTTQDLYDKPNLGGIYQKDDHMIRIQFSDKQDVVLYFSIK